MARSTVEIELLAQVTEATKTVKRFADDTQKQLSGISFSSAVSGINAGFELIEKTAGRAFNTISSVLGDAIDEASQAEQAIVGLSNALRLQNDFSEQAISDFESFASALQEVTTFSDEAALNSLALAKQFKATNEEAKKVVSVAADLAAITGTDLQDATQKVAQTLNGFVDRGLAKAIPELKSLSKEALIAGGALDVIKSRVDGSAQAIGNTFGGAVIKARNSFSDLLETIGGFVTNNPVIIEAIKIISDTFKELNKTFKENGKAIQEIVTSGFLFLIESAPAVLKAIKFIDDVVSTTAVTFYTFARSIGAVAAAIVELGKLNFAGIKEINEAVKKDNAEAFESNRNRLKNFYDPVIKAAESASKKIKEVSTEQKKLFEESKGKSESGAAARIELAKQPEEIRKQIEQATKEPIKVFLELSAKGKIDKEAGIAIGAGLVTNILKGAKGAKDLLASSFGAAADILLPGIGGAVTEIVGILSQGKDEVKKQVQEFARAIPELIKNLSESLPILIETLVRELPPALAKAMPQVAYGFSVELVKNIPTIVKGFAQGLIDAAKGFVQAVIDQVKSLGGLFGGGGGGGGEDSGGALEELFKKGKKLIGLAEGGRVPELARFEGDRFPARLNAGEQVLSKDLSSDLERFLSGGGASQNLTVNFTIGQQQFARAVLDLNRRGFRTA